VNEAASGFLLVQFSLTVLLAANRLAFDSRRNAKYVSATLHQAGY